MVVLLFACWCMDVPKSFVALLVFKSICGVANTDDIFTMPSDAGGEKNGAVEITTPSPGEERVDTDVNPSLDLEEMAEADGTVTSPIDLGGEVTGDKVEINQIETLACNMLGSDTDLAIIF
jgi:hypothetical protein